MVEEMELKTYTASGSGLKFIIPNEKSKFVITAKDSKGQPCCIGGDKFAVESKEAEIRSSVLDKKNGTYEVQYSATYVSAGEHFSLDITHHAQPIHGSPFSIHTPQLLLKFFTAGNQSE